MILPYREEYQWDKQAENVTFEIKPELFF